MSIAEKSLGCGDYGIFEMGSSESKTYTIRCDRTFDCPLAYYSVAGCPRNNGWVRGSSYVCQVAKLLRISPGTPFTLKTGGRRSSYASCKMKVWGDVWSRTWTYTTQSRGSSPHSYQITSYQAGKDFNSLQKCFQYCIINKGHKTKKLQQILNTLYIVFQFFIMNIGCRDGH